MKKLITIFGALGMMFVSADESKIFILQVFDYFKSERGEITFKRRNAEEFKKLDMEKYSEIRVLLEGGGRCCEANDYLIDFFMLLPKELQKVSQQEYLGFEDTERFYLFRSYDLKGKEGHTIKIYKKQKPVE